MIATLPPVGLFQSLLMSTFPLEMPMPRIRSIKPEALQHRKVGRLTDREFRLWVGLITQADDEGRQAGDIDQLRILFFGFHPKVRSDMVAEALKRLEAFGLCRVYEVGGAQYIDFPSWSDHQVINKARRSNLPSYKDSLNDTVALPDRYRGIDRSKDRRNEGSARAGAREEGASASSPERLAPAPSSDPFTDERWPAFKASRKHKTEEQARREFESAIRKQKTPLAKRH